MKKQNCKPLYGVSCSVLHCAYNDKSGHCVSKQISIGTTKALSCADTVCATFRPESEEAEGRIFDLT